MFSIRHFFKRAKRKILRDSLRFFQNAYQQELYGDAVSDNAVRLNIGAGGWHCKGWTNLDYPSQWYSSVQKHPFIPFDIRSGKIPFDDASVTAVYCSHVIEHIEDRFIQPFFDEVFRVLKKGGVFRIACPDAEFLYEVSKTENEYWHWRKEWQSLFVRSNTAPGQVDWLVREIASPKMEGYIYSEGADKNDYAEKFSSMNMQDFFAYITSDLQYRKDYPGDHINWWTFGKAQAMHEKCRLPCDNPLKVSGQYMPCYVQSRKIRHYMSKHEPLC